MNNLSGRVQLHVFAGCIRLRSLILSHNHLSFIISNNANISFPNLSSLSLSSCGLLEFPKFLRHSENLQSLDLSSNNIHEQVPTWLAFKWFHSLYYLNLSHNILTGLEQLPWKGLAYLDLQSNLFEGQLLESVCNLDQLEILNLSNNSFTGRLPQCLGKLRSLSVLDLRKNRFLGTIPAFAPGSKLRNIGLNGNKLEGLLPRSLANCKALEVFDVGQNNINDTFPWWLQSLPKLQVLVLKFNKFYGFISNRVLKTVHPFPELRIFDVSSNQLSGLLPTKLLKHFDAMKDVDETKIGYNYMQSNVNFNGVYYRDSVTVMIKGLELELVKILTIFTTIDLSCNNFRGEIPKSIGYLHSLLLLNMSHNNFVGEIPSVLGNLSNLESLDLSCNQLQGEIPMALTKLTFLAVLNLSTNHLVGRIPRNTQFDTFGNDSYGGNLGLCGFPLSKDCENGTATEPTTPLVLEDENESEFLNYWSVVLMGCGCGLVIGSAMGFLVFSFRKPKWLFGILNAPIRRLERQRKRRVRWRYISIAH